MRVQGPVPTQVADGTENGDLRSEITLALALKEQRQNRTAGRQRNQ
jgi:hypothetical protein